VLTGVHGLDVEGADGALVLGAGQHVIREGGADPATGDVAGTAGGGDAIDGGQQLILVDLVVGDGLARRDIVGLVIAIVVQEILRDAAAELPGHPGLLGGRGTRCSRLAFIRSLGTTQTSPAISDQVAP